ncbi:MAG: hypothetical protein HYW86_01150 [Candidatus Roizmanbacteria bacterium]|nr:MAG: hypothetical protein HYW86_01150 [Candidatus Roizmanbacteria bacterium]
MDWILTTLTWYLYLFVIGIVFFPLIRSILPNFFDEGYAFSKTLGIIFLSYTAFILGLTKIAPFTQLTLITVLLLFAVVNVYLWIKKSYVFNKEKIGIFILEELIFIASLLFLTYVRGQEPSVRGLEKFMDFGFINSIVKSQYFPPLDMWLSADPQKPQGYFINYYYFGHLTGAFLIKLTNTLPTVAYNLILATIFAQGMTLAFSLAGNCIAFVQQHVLGFNKIKKLPLIAFGFLGSFVVNLSGNLHTIYLFTTGYPNENPIPFWKIISNYNPTKYWYPNATRFIPFTIHEFPAYSYVVADLHGHVFDIPFVLLTLALLFSFFLKVKNTHNPSPITHNLFYIIAIGFMSAIHYMTNAFDGPIYLLLTVFIIFIMFRLSFQSLFYGIILFSSFLIFSFPFSLNFSPFVNGIGVNCSPDFLVNLKKLGPFLFEKGNCQVSAPWMLFVLWGFFWISLAILTFIIAVRSIKYFERKGLKIHSLLNLNKIDLLMLLFFAFGTFLITIAEFFYIKDIYPAHFRANTMFKLGYQAFTIMSIASVYALYRLTFMKYFFNFIIKSIYFFLFFFIIIYPFFAFSSYYGSLKKKPQLDGSTWIKNSYPEDKEIIDYLNTNITNQPIILEAQGDSYTDYARISAYTGLPTVAGWWVHEWLWRGSSDVVGKRIPDIVNIYESSDIATTMNLINKYQIKYVVVSTLERNKYPKLNESKFNLIADKIFVSSNKQGAIYQIDQ